MAKTVADLLITRLIAWGVDTIFGYPGDGINGIFESLRTRQDALRFIQVRHEEAAAFAACGYAKYTGRLGVCLATSGPGGIHLLNGLYDAKCDGAAVLAITGHTFHDLIGTQYQQDVDLDKLFMDVAVYNQRVMGPAHVVSVVDEAVKAALSRRGVSHITIPKDIQSWTQSDEMRSHDNIKAHSDNYYALPRPMPTQVLLNKAAEVINAGSKVAILVGRGALGCKDQLVALADRVGGPIIKALLGKAAVPDTHPFTTGGLGLLGTAPSQDAMEECDTLIIIGSTIPYIEFYPQPGSVRTVQIDVDPLRIGLRCPVEVGLVGASKEVLSALLPLIRPKENRSFLEQCQKRMQDWNGILEERGTYMGMPMKPQVVAYALDKLLHDDAIVSGDSGTIATWAARYINIREGMKFSLSGTLATMANCLPYSIAAALAYPGRQVIAFIGDGGFSMLMAEMATIVKYKLPVKVIVIKNNTLGQIKWEQIVFEGNPEYGVELHPIDFVSIARACGAAGFYVEDPRQVHSILVQALEHPGPALVEAVVDPLEPPMPGNIKTQQALKFAEAIVRGQKDGLKILKTVIGNRVREVT